MISCPDCFFIPAATLLEDEDLNATKELFGAVREWFEPRLDRLDNIKEFAVRIDEIVRADR